MKIFTFFSALLILFSLTVFGQKKAENKNSLSIKYIANEGVLIGSKGKSILIDALHRPYRPEYLTPPDDLLNLLENAKSPYDKIDFLLVSHSHLDHFHAASVALHLKNNRRAKLLSSPQIVDEIAKTFDDYEKIKPQIETISHEPAKSFEVKKGAVKIKFLGLYHGGASLRALHNFGHLIEIGGKKLLHIGDADMTAENFSPFNLAKENIDIAFIPYWFLLSENGRRLVAEQFNPKQIIVVHVPPRESEKVSEQLKNDIPGAIVFTKLLEEQNF